MEAFPGTRGGATSSIGASVPTVAMSSVSVGSSRISMREALAARRQEQGHRLVHREAKIVDRVEGELHPRGDAAGHRPKERDELRARVER